MKIVKLTSENYKRLRAVEITPDGNVVTISGRNAQGKSSVLDSIWAALGGKPGNKTTRPVRDGEDSARVVVELDDIRVTREWVAGSKTSTLRVENADGTTAHKSPQQLLDSLVGRLSFDPLEFAHAKEKDQLATLLSVVELPFDPADLDAQRKGEYDERTIVGREVRQLEGQLDGMPTPAKDLPDEEVSASELIARIQAARQEAAKADSVRARVKEYRHLVADLEQRLRDAQVGLREVQKLEAELPDPVDVEPLEDQLATVEETNAAVRAAAERRAVSQRLQDARARYEGHSDNIAAIDRAKEDGLAAAKLPIDGLGFDADGVTYLGVPFKQASAAEQLRVSLAMAMALNPQIRVIRITDGSLLDSDNLQLIEAMAAERDFQVWVERVDESGRVGVVIDDGQVVSA
ncbi:AAA family ATPase [Phytoactinopolyspora limicola]|uniref:AAA family ATPase n=1 Tax=Phytoactinopolyspora limicola TaxID=2715536 RepID=UPI00140A4939|nr:AAA family ATPase [Phytoactinopolyspora limicola]